MTVAVWAMGTQLQRKNPSTLVWETVTGCRDIAGPAEQRDTIEYTNHSSAGGREEFMPGIKRTGEVSTRLVYNPGDAVHQAIRADYESSATREWKLVLTDAGAAEVAFQAFVVRFGFNEPVNNVLEIDFALKCTGDITVTY